jgi:hypothetical protein
MKLEELLQHIYFGWGGESASPNSPAGAGGPGSFRIVGPLQCVPFGTENWLPHPQSPFARLGPIPPSMPMSVSSTSILPAPAGPLGVFEVSQGQITFDAEGNDNQGSPYFSRQISWPGGDSGVTIGRGYDMGDRTETEVKNDLVAAGLDAVKAAAFAKGAREKGVNAAKFVKESRVSLGMISPQVQKRLFENIYPDYVDRAQQNYNKWTIDGSGRVAWEYLDPAIRDVLVDFVYQGYTKGPNPMVKGMRNDYDELIQYILNTPELKQDEAGRNRVGYLQKSKPAKPVPPFTH